MRQRHDVTAPTTGISELKIATLPTGLQLSSLLYNVKPSVEIHISKKRIPTPATVTCGRNPPRKSPGNRAQTLFVTPQSYPFYQYGKVLNEEIHKNRHCIYTGKKILAPATIKIAPLYLFYNKTVDKFALKHVPQIHETESKR